MRFAFCRVVRRNDAVVLSPCVCTLFAKSWVVVNDEIQTEFMAHLALPLFDERRGCEDQHTPRKSAHNQFFEDDVSFNRFAQTDFVAQKRASAQAPQDCACRAELMLKQFDIAQPGQTQELIEPNNHRQARGLERQPKIAPTCACGRIRE